jgi:hypothetical protein
LQEEKLANHETAALHVEAKIDTVASHDATPLTGDNSVHHPRGRNQLRSTSRSRGVSG